MQFLFQFSLFFGAQVHIGVKIFMKLHSNFLIKLHFDKKFRNSSRHLRLIAQTSAHY